MAIASASTSAGGPPPFLRRQRYPPRQITERPAVIKELLQDVRPRQDCEMVIESAYARRLICGFAVPEPRCVMPDLSATYTVILNHHPVTPKVPQALNPVILESGHRSYNRAIVE